MKRFLTKLRNVVGTAVLVLVTAGILVGLLRWLLEPSVPDRALLEIDFEREFVEHLPDDPLARAFLRDKADLLDTVATIAKAANDDRVVALLGRIGSDSMNPATTQELRDAILAFRKKGKKAVAFAETFGEGGAGNQAYYLASAFDKIYVQPSGIVALTGLLAETPFLRGSLDKLHIEPRLAHRKEYKNFENIFTERKFTEAHKQATEAIVNSLFQQLVKGVAEGRGLPPQQIKHLFALGPFVAEEALHRHLVDGLLYRDEVYTRLEKEFGEETKLLHLSAYSERAGGAYERGDTIALIYGTGIIRRGESGYEPLLSGVIMGSETVAKALRAAVDDDEVEAILFRIDSGGGSYVASDTMWHEVVRAREAGKPVIVSMGDVAASGGYFVAMAADKIIAQPGTLTGSIGVVSGKMLTSGFWDQLGVSWDSLSTSDNASFWTSTQDYTDAGWARLQAWLDAIYEDFTEKAARGRNLALAEVEKAAKGRAWTGSDAKALGLVDELGGFPVALHIARQMANLAPDAPIRLKLFPEEKSSLRRLLEEPSNNSKEKILDVILPRIQSAIQPLLALLRDAGMLSPARQPLSMPALGLDN
jgi:protease-4